MSQWGLVEESPSPVLPPACRRSWLPPPIKFFLVIFSVQDRVNFLAWQQIVDLFALGADSFGNGLRAIGMPKAVTMFVVSTGNPRILLPLLGLGLADRV